MFDFDSITPESIFHLLFAVDSIWSIVLRGTVWFAIALIIIISTDNPNPVKSIKMLKSNLGFFIFFLALSGGLMYMLFGFAPKPA